MIDQNKVGEAADYLKTRLHKNITVACVLGTGMNRLEEMVDQEMVIPYEDIPHTPMSTVESHSGRLISGRLGNKHILILAGRYHYYEGYEMDVVTFFIHVLNQLGVKTIIFTNAAGGLNPHYTSGDIVMIKDHINLFPQNPLRGRNDAGVGPRFPDMLFTYDAKLREEVKLHSLDLKIPFKEGVYLGWQGPSLETPAEYKMARMFGADLVGMSTIPEVIVAKYYGLRIAAFSIVSNTCFPISELKETALEDIIRMVNGSGEKLSELVSGLIHRIVDSN